MRQNLCNLVADIENIYVPMGIDQKDTEDAYRILSRKWTSDRPFITKDDYALDSQTTFNFVKTILP